MRKTQHALFVRNALKRETTKAIKLKFRGGALDVAIVEMILLGIQMDFVQIIKDFPITLKIN